MDLSKNDLEKIEDLYENILSESDAEQAGRDTRELLRRTTKWAIEKGNKAADAAVTGTTDFMRGLGLKGSVVLGPGSTIPIDKPKPETPSRPKPPVATPAPTAKQPPVPDSGRSAGEWFAPSRGSSRAADPLVRQGGSYGFFGPIKPQVTKQPPVKPGDNKVKRDPRGAIIVNHFEVENDQVVSEAPAQVAPITGPGGKGWYQKDKEGKYVPITDPEKAKQAATRWKAQQDAKKLAADEKKTPVVSPKPELEPKKKAVPAPERKTDAKVKPAPAGQPAPQASPVAKYMATAAAARKSGDPQKMAAARDMGLEIWRKKYAGTLAKNVKPDGTQKGTGQSVMAKQADELRKLRPSTPPSSEVQTSAKSSLPGGDYSPAATSMMSQRTRNILGTQSVRPAQSEPLTKQPPLSTPQSDAAFKRSGETASALGLRATAANLAGPRTTPTAVPSMNVNNPATAPKKPTVKKEAYDIVLEYLLSEGHVDTIEEAQYVMLQMDAEHIQNIVAEQPQMSPIFQNPAAKYKYGQEARTAAAAEFYKRGIKPEPKRPTLVYNTDGGPVDRSSLAKVRPTVQPSVKSLATKPSVAPAPVKPTPKPQLGPTGKPVVGGVERRTLTSAELRAAQAARAAGKGEAGAISAVSDVAKSNQMASTSPTPVMKPEAPKRESLMQQAADLKATRERIQQQGIKPQI